jgi:hypothetical protein
MNSNYEINYNLTKRRNSQVQYMYINNESDTQTYIFELVFKDKFNYIQVIRRIMKSKQGTLVSADDNILYKTTNKYKLTVLDANYPDKSIIVKGCVDHSLTTNSYFLDNIYLEITQSDNSMLIFTYHINGSDSDTNPN